MSLSAPVIEAVTTLGYRIAFPSGGTGTSFLAYVAPPSSPVWGSIGITADNSDGSTGVSGPTGETNYRSFYLHHGWVSTHGVSPASLAATEIRWQDGTATDVSDGTSIPALPTGLLNTKYWQVYRFCKFPPIRHPGETLNSDADSLHVTLNPAGTWAVQRCYETGSSTGDYSAYVIASNVTPNGWSVAKDESTGTMTVTSPEEALPGVHRVSITTESTDHSHNHQSELYFVIPCVEIKIVVTPTAGE